MLTVVADDTSTGTSATTSRTSDAARRRPRSSFQSDAICALGKGLSSIGKGLQSAVSSPSGERPWDAFASALREQAEATKQANEKHGLLLQSLLEQQAAQTELLKALLEKKET